MLVNLITFLSTLIILINPLHKVVIKLKMQLEQLQKRQLTLFELRYLKKKLCLNLPYQGPLEFYLENYKIFVYFEGKYKELILDCEENQ